MIWIIALWNVISLCIKGCLQPCMRVYSRSGESSLFNDDHRFSAHLWHRYTYMVYTNPLIKFRNAYQHLAKGAVFHPKKRWCMVKKNILGVSLYHPFSTDNWKIQDILIQILCRLVKPWCSIFNKPWCLLDMGLRGFRNVPWVFGSRLFVRENFGVDGGGGGESAEALVKGFEGKMAPSRTCWNSKPWRRVRYGKLGIVWGFFLGGKAGFLQGRSWTTQVFGLETKGAACSWRSRPGSTDTSWCPNHISLTGPSFFLSIFQSYCDCLYLFFWKKGKPWQTPDKESRTSTQIATVPLERNHCIIEVTFGHYLILSHSQLCLKNSLRPITVYGYKYTAIRIL